MYLWQSRSLGRNSIVIWGHLRSASQSVGERDTARVFMAKLHLSQAGMSWALIPVQVPHRSAIQSSMRFVDFDEAKVVKLQLSTTIAFQVRHLWTATICLRSALTPLNSALFILVCYFLIMFLLALTQWMVFTQNVISQDTAHLGAGSSSSLPSDNISIYA